MSNFDMSWWYNPEYGDPDAGGNGPSVQDPPTGTETDSNTYPTDEGAAAGSIGSGGGGDAVGSDPNQWWQDTSIANPGASGNVGSFTGGSLDNILKALVSGVGAAGGALIGGAAGGIPGAIAGGKKGWGWLDEMFADQIWGSQEGMMSPSSPDFVDPNATPPQGIMHPDSPDYVQPQDDPYSWIGRGQTNSGWAAGRPGTGAIGGGGTEKFPTWYATRIDDK